MDIANKQFLDKASQMAEEAQHPFPDMAAAEAALESGWGKSRLAIAGNNLFGTKQHKHPIYGTLNLPTHEWERGQWVQTLAAWVKYPSFRECFMDRVATLRRMAAMKNSKGELVYPHYAAALAATTPEDFVTEVSKTWSTDPNRAAKVKLVYAEYMAVKKTGLTKVI